MAVYQFFLHALLYFCSVGALLALFGSVIGLLIWGLLRLGEYALSDPAEDSFQSRGRMREGNARQIATFAPPASRLRPTTRTVGSASA